MKSMQGRLMMVLIAGVVLFILHNYLLAGLRGDEQAALDAEKSVEDAERRLLAPPPPVSAGIEDIPPIEELLPQEGWPVTGAMSGPTLSARERDVRAKLGLLEETLRSAEGFPYALMTGYVYSPSTNTGTPAGVSALDLNLSFEGMTLGEAIGFVEWLESNPFTDIKSISFNRTGGGAEDGGEGDGEASTEEETAPPPLLPEDIGEVSVQTVFYYLPAEGPPAESDEGGEQG